MSAIIYIVFTIHDLLLNSNSDLHWSLLGTFIKKKNLQNVLRVTVLVSDWLNDDFRVFPTDLTLCKHIVKVTQLHLYVCAVNVLLNHRSVAIQFQK